MKRKAKRIVQRPLRRMGNTIPKEDKEHDGSGTAMPPPMDFVHIYFDQKGEGVFAAQFFEEHQLRQWKTPTGGVIKNWKVCAAE